MRIRVTTGAIDDHKFGTIAEYPDDKAQWLIEIGYAEPIDAAEAAQGEPEGEEPEDLAALSLDELKARCRELGISPRGKKDELAARIAEAEAAQGEPEGEEPEDAEDGDEPPALSAEVPR